MKRIVTLILFLATTIVLWAYDIAVENADGVTIYYNYIHDGIELEVTSYNHSYSDNIVIPESVTYMNRTRKVVSIGNSAFTNCRKLTSVTIPISVTSIGTGAFWRCYGLTSITIPNNVKSIGADAFYECTNLTSVHILDLMSWCKIAFGNAASNPLYYACHLFLNGEEVKDLVIPKGVTKIGEGAFIHCIDLTSITIPNSVTSIGFHAFNGCTNLTSITIPGSVTSIGDNAFQECANLTSVTIAGSVTSIGDEAFADCNVPKVISMIKNPFKINTNSFSDNTFYNATLYVPAETISKYKAMAGWKKFVFIEEGNGR